jgi:hypothetical protein
MQNLSHNFILLKFCYGYLQSFKKNQHLLWRAAFWPNVAVAELNGYYPKATSGKKVKGFVSEILKKLMLSNPLKINHDERQWQYDYSKLDADKKKAL